MSLRLGRVAAVLHLCRGCDAFVFPDALRCPHCGCDVAAEALRHKEAMAEARASFVNLATILNRYRQPTDS